MSLFFCFFFFSELRDSLVTVVPAAARLWPPRTCLRLFPSGGPPSESRPQRLVAHPPWSPRGGAAAPYVLVRSPAGMTAGPGVARRAPAAGRAPTRRIGRASAAAPGHGRGRPGGLASAVAQRGLRGAAGPAGWPPWGERRPPPSTPCAGVPGGLAALAQVAARRRRPRQRRGWAFVRKGRLLPRGAPARPRPLGTVPRPRRRP